MAVCAAMAGVKLCPLAKQTPLNATPNSAVAPVTARMIPIPGTAGLPPQPKRDKATPNRAAESNS